MLVQLTNSDTSNEDLIKELEKLRNEFYTTRKANPISSSLAWNLGLNAAIKKPNQLGRRNIVYSNPK